MKITSLDQLKVGDELKQYSISETSTVLAICGRLVWVTNVWGGSFPYTLEELNNNNFYIEEPKWEPKDNEGYYYPALFDKDLCRGCCFYHTDESDKFAIERGLCFPTKEEAIAAANKMLKALKDE